jgi:hypothetical protein
MSVVSTESDHPVHAFSFLSGFSHARNSPPLISKDLVASERNIWFDIANTSGTPSWSTPWQDKARNPLLAVENRTLGSSLF